jgi:hypothetical protein
MYRAKPERVDPRRIMNIKAHVFNRVPFDVTIGQAFLSRQIFKLLLLVPKVPNFFYDLVASTTSEAELL